jgi:ketosteroid isomerase-like protein
VTPADDRLLQGLLDREAIRQLPITYCHYVRTRNVSGILDLYSPDGVFDLPANMAEGGIRSGREAIRQTFQDNLDTMDPWPFTHNHVVELLDESHARGFVYTEFRLGSEQMRVGFVGVYADDYVKIDGAWKFSVRKLTSKTVGG